jgi:hypothetical protein
VNIFEAEEEAECPEDFHQHDESEGKEGCKPGAKLIGTNFRIQRSSDKKK